MENFMTSDESIKRIKQKAWAAGYGSGYLAGSRHVHGGFIKAIDNEFEEAYGDWNPRPGWHQIDVLEHCRKLAKHAINMRIKELGL